MEIKGKLEINSKGFGFVRRSDNFGNDIFVPGNRFGSAMDGDIVTVKISKLRRGKHLTGKIIDINERSTRYYTGILVKKKSRFYIISPENRYDRDFYVVRDLTKQAYPGDLVIGEIKYYGSADECFRGHIIKVLGDPNDYRNIIYEKLYDMGIEPEFRKKTLREIAHTVFDIPGSEIEKREDLRNIQTFTIDGSDAKDLDDALSFEITKEGFNLGIHIADVSYYVKCGTSLDKDAMSRGTSIYFPGIAVPMLPPELSNGICSLNEGEDRLALSVIFELDKDLKIRNKRFSETVIRSDKRMCYDEVLSVLCGDTVPVGYENFTEALKKLGQFSEILRNEKIRRGAISFNIPEADIKVDERGNVTDISLRKRDPATQLIEDLMILANETVASEFSGRGLPMIYRIHEQPDRKELENTVSVFGRYGVNLKKHKKKMTPSDISGVLSGIEGRREEYLLNRLLLRSMAKARYSTENPGHFALASKAYCHFTSPIRRYPDLCVHRLLKKYILEDDEYRDIIFSGPELKEKADVSSDNEKKASEAERKIEKIKKAEYISSYIGHTFNGIISGVTKWGVYAELENTVEGLVGISVLTDDIYVYNEKMCRLEGRRSGRHITLGDAVSVKITAADRKTGNVDMVITEYHPEDNIEGTY